MRYPRPLSEYILLDFINPTVISIIDETTQLIGA